jgi:hypothetical protein
MLSLESSQIGINIVNVPFKRGNADLCNRTQPVPTLGQRAGGVRTVLMEPFGAFQRKCLFIYLRMSGDSPAVNPTTPLGPDQVNVLLLAQTGILWTRFLSQKKKLQSRVRPEM